MIKIFSIIFLVIILILLVFYLNDSKNIFEEINSIQKEKINDYYEKLNKLISHKNPVNELLNHFPNELPNYSFLNEFPNEFANEFPSEFPNDPMSEFDEINNLEELFELYYKGVYSTYDNDGNIIPGVEPSPIMSINILKELFNLTGDYKYQLKLARLIHRGMHNYQENEKLATEYYNNIIDNCNDSEIKNSAFMELLNLQRQTDHRERIEPIFVNEFRERNPFETFPFQTIPFETIPFENLILPGLDLGKYGTTEEEQRRILNEIKHYNDPQNTHDSGIVRTTKQFVKKLEKEKENNNNNYPTK